MSSLPLLGMCKRSDEYLELFGSGLTFTIDYTNFDSHYHLLDAVHKQNKKTLFIQNIYNKSGSSLSNSF